MAALINIRFLKYLPHPLCRRYPLRPPLTLHLPVLRLPSESHHLARASPDPLAERSSKARYSICIFKLESLYSRARVYARPCTYTHADSDTSKASCHHHRHSPSPLPPPAAASSSATLGLLATLYYFFVFSSTSVDSPALPPLIFSCFATVFQAVLHYLLLSLSLSSHPSLLPLA